MKNQMLAGEPRLSDKKLKEFLAISAEMDIDIKKQKVFTNADDLIRDLKLLE